MNIPAGRYFISARRKARVLLRATLAAVGSASLLAAMAVVGPVAPAQAAGTCSLLVPARVAVSSEYQAVILKLSSDCAAREVGGWASWDAFHPRTGLADMAFFDGTTQEYWDVYDWNTPLGVLTWRPGSCYGGGFDTCVQNSPRTDVRAGSRATLTASARAGSSVTLSVATTYYSPTASVYRTWANEKVQLQYRACPTCTWKYLRNVYTASNGRATYRAYAAHTRYYRAVSADVPSIWGRTSAVLLR